MKSQGCGQKTCKILSKIFCPCRKQNQQINTDQDDENFSNNTTTKEMNKRHNLEDAVESDSNFRTSQCEMATLANSRRMKQNSAAGFVHRSKKKQRKDKEPFEDAFYSETMPYQKQIQEVEFQKLISSSPGSSLNNTFCYDRPLEEAPTMQQLIMPSSNGADTTMSQTKNLTNVYAPSGYTPSGFGQALDQEIGVKPDLRPDLMRKRSSKQSKQSMSNVLKNQGLVTAEQFVAMTRESQELQKNIQPIDNNNMESYTNSELRKLSEASLPKLKMQTARSRMSNNVARVSVPSLPTEEDKEEVVHEKAKQSSKKLNIRPAASKRILPEHNLVPPDKFKLEGPQRHLTKSPLLNLLAPRKEISSNVLKTMPNNSKPSSMSQASNVSNSVYNQKQARIINETFRKIADIEAKNSSKEFSFHAIIQHPKIAKVKNPYLKKSKTSIKDVELPKFDIKRNLSDNIMEDLEFEDSSVSNSSNSSVSSQSNSRLDTDGSRVINIDNGQRKVTTYNSVNSVGSVDSDKNSVTHSGSKKLKGSDILSSSNLSIKKQTGDVALGNGLSAFVSKNKKRPRRNDSSELSKGSDK